MKIYYVISSPALLFDVVPVNLAGIVTLR